MLYCENANDHGILIRTGKQTVSCAPRPRLGDQADRQQGRLLAGGRGAQVLLCGAPKPARWRGGRSGPPRSKGHGSSSSSPIAGFNRRAFVCGWPAAAVDYQVDTARRGSWKTWFVSFGWRCQGDRTTVAVISHADCSDRSALSRWRGACEVFAHERVIGLRLRTAPSGRSRRRLRRGPDRRGETRPSFAAVHESAPGTTRTFRDVRAMSAIEGNSDIICSQ